jgi:hypothetical protein
LNPDPIRIRIHNPALNTAIGFSSIDVLLTVIG